MKVLASLCLLVVTACASDAPDLTNMTCTPSPLSVGAAGPYTVSCVVDFDGSPGDVHWTALGAAGIWTSGSDRVSSSARNVGKYHFSMSSRTSPGVGMLRITLSADHVEGIDGPEGDTITTQIEVVP